MNEKLLKVEDLSVHFSTYEGILRAVENVSFYINKGEWFGLVGESGCGKSVTALSILQLLPVSAKIVKSKIFFDNMELTKATEKEMRQIRGSKIPMIFQDPGSSLNPSMRIGDQMIETIMLHQAIKKKAAKNIAVEMLERVGITDARECLTLYPHELSGGMQQRVLISLAISCQPSLLIADEATSNLDVTIQAEILSLLNSLQKQFGMSILLITHDIAIVASMCERVAVMYAGSIVEQGLTKEVLQQSLHPYTNGLLRAIPSIKSKRVLLDAIPGRVPSLLNFRKGCMFYSRCPKRMEGLCNLETPTPFEIKPGHFISCHLVAKERRSTDIYAART
jgi:peptide/nickel transport system ATP-binding protein